MANINLDLTKFKAAGVYTLEYDDTAKPRTIESNAMRLLVGFNKKGPFNRPVFLSDDNEREDVFGPIDTKLEHKGSYFNRFAQTLLQRTPILALNLLKVDETVQGPDQVGYAALSLDAGTPNPEVASYNKKKYGEIDFNSADANIYGIKEGDTIPYVGNAPFAQFFDRSRFWTPSEENLLGTAALGLGKNEDITSFVHTNFLNFANIGTEEFSILVVKPEALTGYSITAKEWFGSDDAIPYKFIRPNDYIEDYFIQVIAVKGNWTNYKALAADPIFSDFFDLNGIKKDKINSFVSSDGVTLIGSWTGCIIPDFINKAGEDEYIINKINNNTTVTGLLATFNKDAAHALTYNYPDDDEDMDAGWFIDDDEDGNRNDGESETTGKSFLIDLVGHNFKKGYDSVTSEVDHYEKDEFDNLNIPVYKHIKRYGVNFLSYVYDADNAEELREPIRYAQLFNATGVDETPVPADVKNLFIVTNKDEANKIGKGDLIDNDGYDEELNPQGDKNIIPGLTRVLSKTWISVNVDNIADLQDGTVSIKDATFTYAGKVYKYSGNAIYDKAFGKVGFYLYKTIEPVHLAKDTKDSITFYNTVPTGIENNMVGFYEDDALKNPVMQLSAVKLSDNDKSALSLNTETGLITFNVPGTYEFDFLKYNDVISDSKVTFQVSGTPITEHPDAFVKIHAGVAGYLRIGIGETKTLEFGTAKIFKILGVFYTDSLGQDIKLTAPDDLEVSMLTTSNEPQGDDATGNATTEYTLYKGDTYVYMQHKLSDEMVSSHFKFIPMKGLKITKRHLPGYDAEGNMDAEAGVSKIYSVLNEKGIKRALCEPQMITFRYIVDSMAYGLGPQMGGKVYLSQLAKARGKCTALLNAPSKKQFATSRNPYFCDDFVNGHDIKPAFDTKYIPMGGNDELYSSNTFSLPDEDNGAKYTAVFFPYLTYSVNNRLISVPPAADVANVLIRKFIGGDPYMICANNNGILSNVNLAGTEMALDTQDREALEPFGINPIITRNQNTMIYGNQTAYQRMKSDFNKLHIRENLNTIELACDAVLQNYNFLHNTATVRADIVQKLDPILSAAQSSGAIDSYTIQCDENNNTEDIISADYGVVDITVVMNHGMEKIINRITLKRNSVSQ